jgi:hypothetical protein
MVGASGGGAAAEGFSGDRHRKIPPVIKRSRKPPQVMARVVTIGVGVFIGMVGWVCVELVVWGD